MRRGLPGARATTPNESEPPETAPSLPLGPAPPSHPLMCWSHRMQRTPRRQRCPPRGTHGPPVTRCAASRGQRRLVVDSRHGGEEGSARVDLERREVAVAAREAGSSMGGGVQEERHHAGQGRRRPEGEEACAVGSTGRGTGAAVGEWASCSGFSWTAAPLEVETGDVALQVIDLCPGQAGGVELPGDLLRGNCVLR